MHAACLDHHSSRGNSQAKNMLGDAVKLGLLLGQHSITGGKLYMLTLQCQMQLVLLLQACWISLCTYPFTAELSWLPRCRV
jgi:hypothetical protein